MNSSTKTHSWDFYAIIGATLVSHFGSFLNMMALNILVLELTNSAVWVGLVLGVRIVAGMLVSPYLGILSDKYNRKTLMIISDLVLAVAVIGLLVCPAVALRFYILFLMICVGVFASLFDICLKSAIPVMLNTKDTLKANSILMGGRNFVIAGSALCAVFAHVLFKNYNSIFVLDAVTYLVSGFVLYTINIHTRHAVAKAEVSIEAACQLKQSFFSCLKNEYGPVFQLPQIKILLLFMGVLFVDAFASASHNVGWPLVSKAFSAEQPMYLYGVVLFFWAAGNVLGIYALNKWSVFNRLSSETLYLVFTLVMSVGMIITFQTQIMYVIALAAVVAGFGDGTYQTYYTTTIQQIEDSKRGKVFALTNIFLKTGFGLGFIVIPLVLRILSPALTALICHGSVVVICLTGLLGFMLKTKNRTAIWIDNQ